METGTPIPSNQRLEPSAPGPEKDAVDEIRPPHAALEPHPTPPPLEPSPDDTLRKEHATKMPLSPGKGDLRLSPELLDGMGGGGVPPKPPTRGFPWIRPKHQIRAPDAEIQRPEPPEAEISADRSRSRLKTPLLQGANDWRGVAAAAVARRLRAALTAREAAHLHPPTPPAAQATSRAAVRGRRPGSRGPPYRVKPPRSPPPPSSEPRGLAEVLLWRRRRGGRERRGLKFGS
nr:WAS/WASL-interacting protein family member 3-like [Aegilops tauschii subsp. strangulata]